jgi:hypothetical protein
MIPILSYMSLSDSPILRFESRGCGIYFIGDLLGLQLYFRGPIVRSETCIEEIDDERKSSAKGFERSFRRIMITKEVPVVLGTEGQL